MRRTGLSGVLGRVYPARRRGVVRAVAHDMHELETACRVRVRVRVSGQREGLGSGLGSGPGLGLGLG